MKLDAPVKSAEAQAAPSSRDADESARVALRKIFEIAKAAAPAEFSQTAHAQGDYVAVVKK